LPRRRPPPSSRGFVFCRSGGLAMGVRRRSVSLYLPVSYTSSSSGDGVSPSPIRPSILALRTFPTSRTLRHQVSTFAFDYIPVTPGLHSCITSADLDQAPAFELFGVCHHDGGVAYWDDPIIQADNPGYPSAYAVHPVTRSDLAARTSCSRVLHPRTAQALAAFVTAPSITASRQVSICRPPRLVRTGVVPHCDPVSGSTSAAKQWPTRTTTVHHRRRDGVCD